MLREIAEYPELLWPDRAQGRTDRDRPLHLCMGAAKTWNTVQRQHLRPDQIDETLEEVAPRSERGRDTTQWEVGSSAEPADLVDRLLERGLIRDKEPYAVAMVLTKGPHRHPRDRRAPRRNVRGVRGRQRCAMGAFETSEDEIAEARAALPDRWRETINVMHAAWLDGEIVAAGPCAPNRARAVALRRRHLPRARGRGAYRSPPRTVGRG